MTASIHEETLWTYRQAKAQANALPEAERALENQRILQQRNQSAQRIISQVYQDYLSTPQLGAWHWFWFNHFNVFWRKGLVGAALGSYWYDALLPHSMERFDLLLTQTITHPAMLFYLDNVQNTKQKRNENLGRELLELHTLGAHAGYSQTDVQACAAALTGLGLVPVDDDKRDTALSAGAVLRGQMLFDPRKHQQQARSIFGISLPGRGFEDILTLLAQLARHPATIDHLTHKLGLFWFGESAKPQAIRNLRHRWETSDGNLADLFNYLHDHHADATPSFTDPHRYLFASLHKLSLDARLKHPERLSAWLTQLGQPLFACATPQGYSLKGSDWQNSGQLMQRFETARDIVENLPALFGHNADTVWQASTTQQWLTRQASQQTQQIIHHAADNAQKLTLLLSSPEWMYQQGWGNLS